MIVNLDTAQKIDYVCNRGDTFDVVLKFYTDDTMSSPVDISLDTFKMSVIRDDKTRPVLLFEIGDGITISNTNELSIKKTAQQMNIRAGKYLYDLERTMAGGNVITAQKGYFIIHDDATDI